MHIPDFLEEYRKEAEIYLRDECFREITFSGPTYQVQLQDPKTHEEIWVFAQLNPQDELKDIFCSCEYSSQKGSCSHMLGALLHIFYQHSEALHRKFDQSFWKIVFWQWMLHYGPHPKFERNHNQYLLQLNEESKLIIEASSEFQQKLKQILEEKVDEHEENSIKFSNLSEKEMEDWQRGQPSESLQFELSCWSDLAKWFMLIQQYDIGYEITFTYGQDEIPCRIKIASPLISINGPLEKPDVLQLIPALSSVRSPLQVFSSYAIGIESIFYDAKDRALVIKWREKYEQKEDTVQESVILLGEWNYLPYKGFFKDNSSHPLQERISSQGEIAKFFKEHLTVLKQSLEGYAIDEGPHRLSYQLFWDKTKNLCIEAYIKHPHDLTRIDTAIFGDWAFIEENGFYRIEPFKFKQPFLKISKENLNVFLRQHRAWLNHFEEFKVHLTKVEERLIYDVDENGTMTFSSQAEAEFFEKDAIDLGEWIWIKSKGFYLKEQDAHGDAGFGPGTIVPPGQVAFFIRQHYDNLQNVKGFFAQESPVDLKGLHIELRRGRTISITPEYHWKKPEHAEKALFFDEFVHAPNEGFCRLSFSMRPLAYMRSIDRSDPLHWNHFFQELLPKLKEEFTCTIDPSLEKPQELVVVMDPEDNTPVPEGSLSITSAKRWDTHLYYRSEKGVVPVSDLQTYLKRGEKFCPTEAGLLDLEEERFRWLRSVKSNREKQEKNRFSLGALDIFRINAFETVVLDEANGSLSAKQTLKRLLDMQPTDPPEFPALASELRHYQQLGLEWLWFLRSNGLSGLLCDDMGLGKTHQAMALMAAIYERNKRSGRSSSFLIICPTSVAYHWQDKLQRFLPALRVKEYWGVQRSFRDFSGNYEVFLTTYGVWRNDWKDLKTLHFDAAFFDELQVAKNHISQIHQTLHKVTADTKVGLTGTPIENQIRELKSLFDLILPGYMPKDSEYRDLFMRPLEKNFSNQLLSRFVHPFILRRKKQDVLTELPDKTEEIRLTELLGEQKRLYDQVASQEALPLIQQLKDEKEPIPYLHIFALIASLKQICNHPASFLKDVSNYEQYESGKWEAFLEILEEARESGQKVVVFSQYLAMLDIMGLYFHKHHISFAEIRGITRDRKAEIDRFQNDPNCTVFLASLQAAGLGIDLTAASCVIHYDRWWNPARENQATDRVHRIGQTRGVQVFKFVTKATIEEKIDQILVRKQRLFEDVISADDHRILKQLSRNEILEILHFVSY